MLKHNLQEVATLTRLCLTLSLMLIGAQTVSAQALPPIAQPNESYEHARKRMVAEFLEKEGIHNPRVLEAMRQVPRHEFVSSNLRSKAYWDSAWPIGHKQTITWPYVVAFMTESLDPKPSDRVLEVGTGSGYQAAVLSVLVKEVYSIEIIEPLGKSAEKRLKRLGYKNVTVKIGDGYAGWREHAPFDKIILTCSPETIPQPLIDQLKEGGRMVLPLGEKYRQEMVLLEKKNGKIVEKQLMPTNFVPMTGRSDKERFGKPDPLKPQIVNGGFEERYSTGQPSGWYYQRQLTLIDQDPPQGHFYAQFDNDEPGRRAQAMQAMAIDGQKLGTLKITITFRAKDIIDGPESFNKAGVQLIFDDYRHLLGDVIVTHWTRTSGWNTISASADVPEDAKQVVVRVGLNGATGQLSVDDIKLTAEKR